MGYRRTAELGGVWGRFGQRQSCRIRRGLIHHDKHIVEKVFYCQDNCPNMDLFDSPEEWSIEVAGTSIKGAESGRLTDIMNSSAHVDDPAPSTVSAGAAVTVKAEGTRPARKRRAPSETRLAQNARAQKRYRCAAQILRPSGSGVCERCALLG